MRFVLLLILLSSLLILVFFPEIDLFVSHFFYDEVEGFWLRDSAVLMGLKRIAFYGSRAMALFLAAGAIYFFLRKKRDFALSKASLFLLCGLLIGPGLLANVVLKENWGRARPRDVAVYGGEASFTPAAYLTNQCKSNCSFVSGDASFGFFLPTFAYVVVRRRRKFVFFGGLAVGTCFALARIMVGAHFLSDTFFALTLIFVVSALLHALFYGRVQTAAFWRDLF